MPINLSDHDKEIIRLVDAQVMNLSAKSATDNTIIATLITYSPWLATGTFFGKFENRPGFQIKQTIGESTFRAFTLYITIPRRLAAGLFI